MAKIKAKDKKAALQALDGIIEIAKNDMLRQGVYLTDEVKNQELKKAGAVCGGKQACLYGSLWVSAGYRRVGSDRLLYGVASKKRERYMKDKPALKIASDALEQAAKRRIVQLDRESRDDIEYMAEMHFNNSFAEAYFESDVVRLPKVEWASEDNPKADPKKIISLVRSAKKIVEKA